MQFGLRPIPPLDKLAARGGKYLDMSSSSRLASPQNGLELYATNLCSRGLADDTPEVGERLSELQNRTAHLIDDARRMSHELHPSMLEHLGLVAAVRSYYDEETHRGGLAVRFDPIRPPESISPETSSCLFRVVQEGVRNAAKHSRANAVQATLRRANGSILLAIADNGSGFDPSADRNGGLGLISMAERVRAIGGRFDILSDPNEGTRLEVSLPAL